MPYQTTTVSGRIAPTSAPVAAPSTSGCGCGCSCQSCGSLQCLCRPRFFAGQLVTDADFRRLDQYLVGKDRLHNRYLHGTGVVCGLEVVCNPCDDTVTVRPGYALGPCGEDIVVCADTGVDVGAMIRAQRRAQARTDCPPYSSPPADCDALEQRWVLGICYDEQPGRPVTTLSTTGSSASCSCGGGCSGSGGCGSGGSGGRGCGCGASPAGSGSTGGTSAGNTSYSASSAASSCGCGGTRSGRPVPAGCEPTVICEGFRFTLTKEKPVLTGVRTPKVTPAVEGALATHVQQCLAMLRANVTAVPSDATAAQLVVYCCELKADLGTVIDSGAVHDCTLGQRLNAIACPDPTERGAGAQARRAITQLLQIAVDVYRECVCSALLPPCPDDCVDDCVPIATLTVRSSDLRVLDVCNWSSRKFAVTVPMLGYWLGWLPFASAIRKEISTLCCPPQRLHRFTLNEKLTASPEHIAMPEAMVRPSGAQPSGAQPSGAQPSGAQPSGAQPGAPAAFRIAAQYAQHTSPLAGLEAPVLQGLGVTGPDGADLATATEMESPFTALALSRLLGPEGLDLGGPLRAVTAALSGTGASGATAPGPVPEPPGSEARLAELEKAVESLQRTVRSQARTINTLRGEQGGKGGPK